MVVVVLVAGLAGTAKPSSDMLDLWRGAERERERERAVLVVSTDKQVQCMCVCVGLSHRAVVCVVCCAKQEMMQFSEHRVGSL
jgi:hypothetical protein